MKLIGSLTSPYVRKARIVLAEKHIGYNFELEMPWNMDTHVPDYNPLGKVPVLVMDDGTSLFDSRVIVEYLDNINPVSRLIPESNRRRIMVKRWEALSDGFATPLPPYSLNAGALKRSKARSGFRASKVK